jgi:DNA excision repair protein ERCC-3
VTHLPASTLAPRRPLVVQTGGAVLLETAAPGADDARDALLPFAELEKSPEHVHTWRLTPLSLWNAAAAGETEATILAALERHARAPVPESVRALVRTETARWGRVRLTPSGLSLDAELARELGPLPKERGPLKLALARQGWPAQDTLGLEAGAPLAVELRPHVALRPYQREAVAAFEKSGAGTVVLPCGAGKTVVGLAAIASVRARTLVLATGTAAARQWRDELLDKTTLEPASVHELTAERRSTPGHVTLATYSLLARRPAALEAVAREDWGLVILDEVHLAPAAVLELLERLQGRRRLGLTATLARADGRDREVFALVGPRLHSVPWKALERSGWIAEALCTEVRVPLSPAGQLAYSQAPRRERPALAAENPEKLGRLERLLERHPREPLLILGSWLDQLEQAASLANAPLVSGSSGARERELAFADFRAGKLRRLVLSRIGSHAIDLPEAAVAIQLSGTFGSKQEEAQRLGRILRPKKGAGKALFYTLVTPGTVEEDWALERQLFLTEQGYRYEIEEPGSAS